MHFDYVSNINLGSASSKHVGHSPTRSAKHPIPRSPLRHSFPAMPDPSAQASTDGFFKAIIESSSDAILSKDLNGVITSWNPGAERIFGYTAEEAVGQHVSILIPKERHNEEPQILSRISRGECL